MRKVVLALVAALTALFAAPALAVDGTLSSASKTYAWEGGPMNGAGSNSVPAPFGLVRCSAVYQCDNEHIELKEQGGLTVEIKAGSGSEDLDVRLYKSDAEGTAPGTPTPGSTPEPAIAEDIRTEKDAKITVRNLKPGFYVIQVAAFTAINGTYNGTATFAPAAPSTAPAPAAAPAPTTAPAPQQTSPTRSQNKADESKRKRKLAACNKKAKKIKNKKKAKKAKRKCAKKFGKKKA